MKKAMLVLLCGMWVGLANAQTSPPQWMRTGATKAYQAQASGDPVSASGAEASIASVDVGASKPGILIARSDASRFLGKTVKLAADISTHDADQGATIFLNVFGPKGHLGFISSDRIPVLGDATQIHREIQIGVPSTATFLTYGVALHGKGSVRAEHIRLVAGAAIVEVSPKLVLDKAIEIVRTNALRAKDVDWATVEPQIRAMAANAQVSQEVYPAIRALLKSLGDHHSHFEDPSSSALLGTQGGAHSLPTVEVQPHGIGYIAMPGYEGQDPQAIRHFSTEVVDAIGRIAPQVRCGWIVDLREDGGGNMKPMLAGLSPLLGQGTARLFGFRDADDHVKPWSFGHDMAGQIPGGPDLSQARVAVLTGPHTASSGEIVAIAFRGRPNTRSFGEPTAGMSTSNQNFALPDGSMLVLTTAVDVDRNGNAYGAKIQPDQLITADGAGTDTVLNEAQAWLMLADHCRQ